MIMMVGKHKLINKMNAYLINVKIIVFLLMHMEFYTVPIYDTVPVKNQFRIF